MLTTYRTEMKRTEVWYKMTFCHLINMCTCNPHVLHQNLGKKMEAFQFRENLTERITVGHNPVLEVLWLSS